MPTPRSRILCRAVLSFLLAGSALAMPSHVDVHHHASIAAFAQPITGYTLPPDKLQKARALYLTDIWLFLVTSIYSFILAIIYLRRRWVAKLRLQWVVHWYL